MTGIETPEMTIGSRIRALRASRAMTQEDLAAMAGLGLATIQRVERGLPAAPGTIASLAAAFDLTASDLTGDGTSPDDQPYVPLVPVRTGRQLGSLLARVDRLDFEFSEIDNLAQAEIIEELEAFCSPIGAARTPPGAVAQVRQELAARELLARLADAGLAVSGANYSLNCAEIDDDMGAGMPILWGNGRLNAPSSASQPRRCPSRAPTSWTGWTNMSRPPTASSGPDATTRRARARHSRRRRMDGRSTDCASRK